MRVLLIVLSDASRMTWAQDLAKALEVESPTILVGSPADAAEHLASQLLSPSDILLDLGERGQDVLPEIDRLAAQCESGTQVIAIGNTNDIQLYRAVIQRGVLDYLPFPIAPQDIARILIQGTPKIAATKPTAPLHTLGKVFSFLSAASGDGASTAALNTAVALSRQPDSKTILVDMDYQFGMVATNLNLDNQYGIRDIFDHPERVLDGTLIRRMVVRYDHLDIIAAPSQLFYPPQVGADAVRELIQILKQHYDYIVLDLPHLWTPWVASTCQQSDHIILVAQLYLKSVGHAVRLMRSFRDLLIAPAAIIPVLNRSGSRFREAIERKDFERLCGLTVRHTLANDIKVITEAESSARSVLDASPSHLSEDIQRLAATLSGTPHAFKEPASAKTGGLLKEIFTKRNP